MRKITEIIVHCSATRAGQEVSKKVIERWHRVRGFACIGYHWLVHLDGRVEAGRPEWRIGAHCRGHNARSVGVCYIGGVLADGRTPADTRTPAQKEGLRRLVAELQQRYPGATVHGHREFAAKACPCFDVQAEL